MSMSRDKYDIARKPSYSLEVELFLDWKYLKREEIIFAMFASVMSTDVRNCQNLSPC